MSHVKELVTGILCHSKSPLGICLGPLAVMVSLNWKDALHLWRDTPVREGRHMVRRDTVRRVRPGLGPGLLFGIYGPWDACAR